MIASDLRVTSSFLKMDDCIVFIDGAYLSLVSKFLGKGKPIRFNIKKFAERLTTKENLACKDIFYYNCLPFQGTPPN